VICTRAIESLALIVYTSDVEAVKETVIKNKWFASNEVVIIDNEGK